MDDELKRLARELLAKINAMDELTQDIPGVPLQAALAEILALAEIGEWTIAQYERGLRLFEIYLGRPATSTDLTHDTVNGFFRWLSEYRRVGATTVKTYRGTICRIWNHLAADEVVKPYIVRKLRTPKIKRKLVEAWSTEQIEQLLRAANSMKGSMRSGTPKKLFIRAHNRRLIVPNPDLVIGKINSRRGSTIAFSASWKVWALPVLC